MIGELPKLFERNFVVGYFLPVVAFAAASFGLITGFGLSLSVLPILTENVLANTTIIILASWLIAVALLAMNRSLYMLLEGYGRFNPARLLGWREKRRYRKLLSKKKKLVADFLNQNDQGKQSNLRIQLDEINYDLANQFPDNKRLLLPTRFGNAVRAFEVYSRFIYGFEATVGWNRLLAVVPKDYRELVSDAKAQTDFWLNLWVISILSLVEYIGLAIYSSPKMLWFPLTALLVAFFASSWARTAAVEWGDIVKASFDTFLPELGTKLKFPTTSSFEEEKELWTLFSNVILFRSADAFRTLNAKLSQLSEREQEDSAEGD